MSRPLTVNWLRNINKTIIIASFHYLDCQVQWRNSLDALRPSVNISVAVDQKSKNEFTPSLLSALQQFPPKVGREF